jgi:hypothetical protein
MEFALTRGPRVLVPLGSGVDAIPVIGVAELATEDAGEPVPPPPSCRDDREPGDPLPPTLRGSGFDVGEHL